MSQPFELNTRKSSYDQVVVIDGNRYAMRGTTRASAQAIMSAEASIKALREEVGGDNPETTEQADRLVSALLDVIAGRLRPLEDAPPVSDYLREAWKRGDLELEQIKELGDLLGEKAEAIQEATARPPA